MFRPGTRSRHLLLAAVLVGVSLWLLLPGGVLLGANGANVYVPLVYRQPTPTPDPGWRAEYYSNRHLSGTPFRTRYEAITYPDYEWGEGAPLPGMPENEFSVRWTRNVWFDPGTYQFILTVDDGGRLYIDGVAVIDEWHGSLRGTASYVHEKTFAAGGYHEIKVEYYEHFGDARMRAFWTNKTLFPQWRAEYYNNQTLSGEPVLVRNESTITRDWQFGSPAPGVVNHDNFSARFTRAFYLDGNGTYVFRAAGDDGVMVWVDFWTPGQPTAVDHWEDKVGAMGSSMEILPPGWYVITVTYREAVGYASLFYQHLFGGTDSGMRGEYYANEDLSGTPVHVRDDYFDQTTPYKLFFKDYGTGAPPGVPGMPADHFSIRWRHTFEAEQGKYRFVARADDGVRIYVDDALILDRWIGYAGAEVSAELDLYGKHHVIRVDYHDHTGDANVRFYWQKK